jgi:hypothetical protein
MALVHTLPRLGHDDKVAALSCPDCAGTLAVRVEGASGHLHFECRIGHSYALGSLLAGKEEAVEHRLWSALVSLEELASLLEELQGLGQPYTAGREWTAASQRISRLRSMAISIRSIIDRNAPIDLGMDAGLEVDRSC